MDKKYRQLQVDVANLKEDLRTMYEYQQKLNESIEKMFKLLFLLNENRQV